MNLNNMQKAFFDLLRAGLWEKNIQSTSYENKDYLEIYRIASEQSVLGLVAAGIEHFPVEHRPSQEIVLTFVDATLQLEQRNKAMNTFIPNLLDAFKDVRPLLVKGQGIGQCYERPLWRACGDVDLLLDVADYEKGKKVLSELTKDIHVENPFDKHYSATIGGWEVELHGSLRSLLPVKADKLVDTVQAEAFKNRRFRIWDNDGKEIYLPYADDDVIFTFTHILKHFFHYGIGLRQVCDLCRLLWTYRDSLDLKLLENRLHEAGLMTEWKAFGAVAVDWLGMPDGAYPFYSKDKKWKQKSDRIIKFILETGNFGHNRDTGYYSKYPGVISQVISFGRHTWDSARHALIFPVDALKVWGRIVVQGVGDTFIKNKN